MTPDERAAWLLERQNSIGASDVAPILGMSPWANAFTVWVSKTQPLSDDDDMTEQMEAGILFENPIIDRFALNHPELHVADRQSTYRREGLPDHHSATPDALAYIDWPCIDPDYVIDAKLTSEAPWEDIPDHYAIQGLWQMYVAGTDAAYFPVCHIAFGRVRFREYFLERDQGLIDRLIKQVDEFWFEYVVPEKVPPIDGSEASRKAIAELWPEQVPGASFEIDQADLDEYWRAKTAHAEARAAFDDVKTRLEARFQDAESACVDGHPVLTLKKQERRNVDVKALTEKYPKVAAEVVKTNSFRVLRPAPKPKKPHTKKEQ